eukprot:jgi/Mesen1/6413/ME000329S05578
MMGSVKDGRLSAESPRLGGRESIESPRAASGEGSDGGGYTGRESLEGRMIRKGYVDTQEGQMHYRRCGEGHALLMLHQTPASSAMWTAVLPRLAVMGYHAIALDLPNCGESYSTSEEPTIDDLEAAIMAAVQALGFPPSFDLGAHLHAQIGHQSGASIAMKIAVDFPKRVRKLVMWGVPILGLLQRGDILRESAPDYEDDFFNVVADFIAARFPHPDHPWQLKATVGDRERDDDDDDDDDANSMLGILRTSGGRTYERRPWTTRAMALVDHESLLKQIEQPTLCMAGDNEALQMSTTKAALLLKSGKYCEIKGASRDVCDEFPDEYVEAVVEFLNGPGLPVVAERSSLTMPASKDAGDNSRASEGHSPRQLQRNQSDGAPAGEKTTTTPKRQSALSKFLGKSRK